MLFSVIKVCVFKNIHVYSIIIGTVCDYRSYLWKTYWGKTALLAQNVFLNVVPLSIFCVSIQSVQYNTTCCLLSFSAFNVIKMCVFKNIPVYSIIICTLCDYRSPLWNLCKLSSIISYWRISLYFRFLFLHIKVPSLTVTMLSYYHYTKCNLKYNLLLKPYSCKKCDYVFYIIKISTNSIKLCFYNMFVPVLYSIICVKKYGSHGIPILPQVQTCDSLVSPKCNFIPYPRSYHNNAFINNHWRKSWELHFCEFPTVVPFYTTKVLVSCDIIFQYYPTRKLFSCTKCYCVNMIHWCFLWNITLWTMNLMNLLYPNFLFGWYHNAYSSVFLLSTANLYTLLWWRRMDELILYHLNSIPNKLYYNFPLILPS